MTAIVTSKFRTLNAENFKDDINTPVSGSSVFVAIGKPDAWSYNVGDTTDTEPFTPYDTIDSLVEARENIFALKKLNAADVSHVVPRHTVLEDLKKNENKFENNFEMSQSDGWKFKSLNIQVLPFLRSTIDSLCDY